jgi:hypothetical protein
VVLVLGAAKQKIRTTAERSGYVCDYQHGGRATWGAALAGDVAMLERFLADVVVVFHLLFIAFAICGGVLVLRWRRVMWVHLPAVAWAVLVEVMSWRCPLTPLENHFRRLGGQAGYRESFVEHYVMPVLYPTGLTDEIQMVIGCLVFAVNAAVYGIVIARSRRGRTEAAATAVQV